MTTMTIKSRVHNAIAQQAEYTSAYVAIGKTSPWTDDSNPPNDDPKATALTEVIGYKKVKQFSLARLLKTGETAESISYPVVVYKGQQWALIPIDKAYDEEATFLYVEAEIQPDDFPLGMFRQVGLFTGLTPNAGVTKQNLLPSEVANIGLLRVIENREPQNRTASVTAFEQLMLAF
jgi:hypothetical protein